MPASELVEGSGPALASEVQWAPEKSVAAAGEICVGTERTVAVGAEGAASAGIVPAFGSDCSTNAPGWANCERKPAQAAYLCHHG